MILVNPNQDPFAVYRQRVVRSDAQLVDALRTGDEAAFRILVGEWHASLLRVAQIFVPSRAVAEEVVQETWHRRRDHPRRPLARGRGRAARGLPHLDDRLSGG
jgi:DNA-directed RNA polymerase specialized sigma24 family protein